MDREAFNELVLSHLDEVTAFAHYLADTDWEAEDLVQSTYESAFERWDSLSSRDSCRSWLFRIARNQWIDWMRSRDATPKLELVDDPDDPYRPRQTVDPERIDRATDKQVHKGLKELSDTYAEAVVLCDIWGFSYEEIADIIEAPLGTVRSRISRGRRQLSDVISRFEDEAQEDA